MDRAKWQRTLPELLKASDQQILQILEKDGLLPKWAGHTCPRCWKGTLRRTVHQGVPKYRCSNKGCFVAPHHLHPLFQVSSGQQYQPLQVQAALLFLLLLGASHPQCRLILGVNHKMNEGMSSRLANLRKSYVEATEKKMVFGDGKRWVDVEADEATFDRSDVSKDLSYKDAVAKGKCILWEQWSGLLVRGKPQSLVLTRLSPALSVKRAPGPGAIHKMDWAPIAEKHLVDRKVVLHTDSAKSYKAKTRGVLHDCVVHCKKKQVHKGKVKWSAPQYVRVVTHKLPGGKTLKVKAGTQHIDRAWRFIKDRIRRNQKIKAGTKAIRARIRGAQYEYWFRGCDLWLKTGELAKDAMSAFVSKP
eukprot:Skav219312  [mRNA]  locus=scaffold1152:119024:120103:- [translate_table: standard]